MSRYIGDLDVIWSLASSPFSGRFTKLCTDDVKSRRLRHPSLGASLGFAANNVKSRRNHTSYVFPCSIPILAGPPPPSNTVTGQGPGLVIGGGGSPVEAQQLHSNTQSHWSSGSTVSFLPRMATVCLPGMNPHLQWNCVLLLAMFRYR
jgi:hypothetical protein